MTSGWSQSGGMTIPAVLDAQAERRPDQPALHVLDAPVTYRELRDRSVAAAPDVPSLRTVVLRDTAADPPDRDAGAAPAVPAGLNVVSIDVFDEPGDGVSLGAGPAWTAPGAIFFTSGTTGRSKGAVVTQHY